MKYLLIALLFAASAAVVAGDVHATPLQVLGKLSMGKGKKVVTARTRAALERLLPGLAKKGYFVVLRGRGAGKTGEEALLRSLFLAKEVRNYLISSRRFSGDVSISAAGAPSAVEEVEVLLVQNDFEEVPLTTVGEAGGEQERKEIPASGGGSS